MDPRQPAGHDPAPALACGLSSDQAGLQKQRWLQLAHDAGLGRAETDDGMAIRFRDEPAAERELRELVAVESGCCSWARWDVRRTAGELVLQVHAAGDGLAALQAMFGA